MDDVYDLGSGYHLNVSCSNVLLFDCIYMCFVIFLVFSSTWFSVAINHIYIKPHRSVEYYSTVIVKPSFYD